MNASGFASESFLLTISYSFIRKLKKVKLHGCIVAYRQRTVLQQNTFTPSLRITGELFTVGKYFINSWRLKTYRRSFVARFSLRTCKCCIDSKTLIAL